jgi:hypothetical protein
LTVNPLGLASGPGIVAILTLVGTLATLAGLVLTLLQVRKTKTAAEAAKKAVDETLDRLRAATGQYAVSMAKRRLIQVRELADNKNWMGVASRLDELAESTAQLAQTFPAASEAWMSEVGQVHEWSATFARHASRSTGPKAKELEKWTAFATAMATKFDRIHGPLGPR